MKRLPFLPLVAAAAAAMTGCSSPPPQAGWEYTGGPEAQNVTAIVGAPGNPDVLTAAMSSGYVARSSDRGRSWTTLSQTDAGAIRWLHQDADDPAGFLCLGDRAAVRSRDGGKTWSRITVLPRTADAVPTAYAVDPWNGSVHLAALGPEGLFRSTDGGETWGPAATPRDTLSPTVRSIAFDPTVTDRAFALVDQRGVWMSTNGGSAWSQLGTPDATGPVSSGRLIVLHSRNRGWMLVATAAGSIVRTTDGGGRWVPVRKGEGPAAVVSLANDPLNPDVVFAGTEEGALVSTDFGIVWRAPTPTLPAVTSGVAPVADPAGTALYVFGEGVGVQRWMNGSTTTERVDADLGGSTVSATATGLDGREVYCVVGSTVHRLDSAGTRWSPASAGLSGYPLRTIAVDGKNAATVVVSAGDGIYRTTDAGRSWKAVTRNLRAVPANVLDPHPIITTRLYASGRQGLFVSMNNGVSWVQAKPVTRTFALTALTHSPVNAAVLYGAAEGIGVVRSSDAGFTWDVIAEGVPTSGLVAITLDPADRNLLYAWSGDGGGYRTTDGGDHWTSYTPPWPRGTTALVAVDRFAPSRAAALVNSQLAYVSANGGGTWTFIPVEELGEEAVSLHYNSASGTLYAGTRFAGVFRLRGATPTGSAPAR